MRRWTPALAVFLVVAVIVWTRLAQVPLSPYGSNGAAYIEHGSRIQAALTVSRMLRGDGWADGENLIVALDDSFPPMLHVLALPLTVLFDGRVGPVAAFGVFWLLLMGLSVGSVAQRVSGDRRAGPAVAIGVFLLPGLHGSATRYYFDLPMSAFCWLAVALLMAGWDLRPLRAGVLAGLAGAAACLTKWTALPFLALLLLGAAVTAQPGGPGRTGTGLRRRLIALGALAGTMAGLLGTYLALAGPDNSLLFTIRESALDNSHEGGGGGVLHAIAGMLGTLVRGDSERGFRLKEHLEGLAFAVFSPGLLLATLLLLGVWLLRSRRGAGLVGWGALGQLAFLVIWIRPVDERFLLVAAPALILGAGIGWSALGPSARRTTGTLLVAAGLLVALDFHHFPKTAATTWWTEADLWGPHFAPYPPPPRPRGIGASTSAQGRGWVRKDEELPYRGALRAALLRRVDGCKAELFAALDGRPFITVDGSHDWLGFELRRRQLREPGRPAPTVYPINWEPDPDFDPTPGSFQGAAVWRCMDDGDLPPSVVVFAEAPVGEAAPPPACPSWALWRPLGTVEAPDGGPGVSLWSPYGRDPCSPSAPDPFAPAPE